MPSLRRIWPLALAFLFACRGPSPVPDHPAPVTVSNNSSTHAGVLGPGDLIEVRVTGEPDFSGAYRVSSRGTIDFPYCERFPVQGLEPDEVASKLSGCLQPRVLKNPQITVLLREYNSKKVFVFGEVQKPGEFSYEERMSVVQAISLAGGFTKTAAKNSCNVTRTVDGQEQRYKVQVEDIAEGKAANFTLLPGDIVFVPESFF